MEISSANSHASGSAAARPLERISVVDVSSPLLLKRLQQQRKQLNEARAEAKKGRTQPLSDEHQTPSISEGSTLKYTAQYSSTRSGSTTKSNRWDRNIDKRIEGMGVREMDQFICTIKKQNFDLKLSLFHLRQKASKTETELSYLQTQLTRANARADELTQANSQLREALQEREKALDDAVKIIGTLQDDPAKCDATYSYSSVKQPEFSEQGTVPGGAEGPNNDSAQGLEPIGVSQFTYRTYPTSLNTSFCDGSGSTYFSANSNSIDLKTPCSVAHNDISLTKTAFLPGDRGHTPVRASLAPSEFMSRCTSVMSDGDDGPPSPTFSITSLQLSMLSESSFASMYRDHSNDLGAYSEDDDQLPSNHDKNLQAMETVANPGNNWDLTGVQKLAGVFTPSRRASPNRRVSPRREMMEFKNKGRDKISRDLEMGRSAMPPTPESVLPRGTGEFNSSKDDTGDDANYCMSMVLPTEIDEQTKSTSLNEGVYESVTNPMNALEVTLINEHNMETTSSKSNQHRSFKFLSGQTTVAAQNEQAFGDITNMRGTHNRLGYGSGGSGNRNHTGTQKKHVGPDLIYNVQKHVSGYGMNKKVNTVAIPVRTAVTRGLPVGTPVLTTPQTGYNLVTPPYTPNSDSTAGAAAARRLAHKGSWESFNSGSNSAISSTTSCFAREGGWESLNLGGNFNYDRATLRRQVAPHAVGSINVNIPKRGNTAVTVKTTKLSVTLNKGLNGPLANLKRSGIPSLVKSSSQKMGGGKGEIKLKGVDVRERREATRA